MAELLFTRPVLYHGPTLHIGSTLPPREKAIFIDIRDEIKKIFNPKEKFQVVIFNVIRKFNKTDVLGMDESMVVLKNVVKFIRHLLVDVISAASFMKLVQLIDGLVRKSGIRAHVLIGRKKFLQTLSIRARQFKKQRPELSQDAADYTFDCIQAWHEAFFAMRSIFPHYSEVYYKLLYKYKIQFPRSENDPSRFPILLEQCDDEAFEDGPNHFLFSESIDASEAGVQFEEEYLETSEFDGGNENQSVLRAIEGKQQGTEGNDQPIFDDENEANYSPAKKPPTQQIVSQKSVQVSRNSTDKENAHEEQKEADSQNLAKSRSNDTATPKMVTFSEDTIERDDKERDGIENNNQSDDDQSLTIENRAFVVDGRVGIDTRAVLNQNKKPSARFNKNDGTEQGEGKQWIDADGRVRYDHYKSEQVDKKLKSVPSHLYNQKSVRGFNSIEERIERFNSRDSMEEGSAKKTSRSRSRDSEENTADNKPVEIRFFGNQRVVIRKDSAHHNA